jgi:uncharacterized membrane protein
MKEIKSEIQRSLDNVPESVLMDVLAFLKRAEQEPAEKLDLAVNIRDILDEDRQLLERLAK